MLLATPLSWVGLALQYSQDSAHLPVKIEIIGLSLSPPPPPFFYANSQFLKKYTSVFSILHIKYNF